MPIYEYRCGRCVTKFEKLCRADVRDEDVECPSCGCREAGRTISSFVARGGAPSGERSSPARQFT